MVQNLRECDLVNFCHVIIGMYIIDTVRCCKNIGAYYIYVHIPMYIYTYVHIPMYLCTYTYVHIPMYLCTFNYVPMDIYLLSYVHIPMYLWIFAYFTVSSSLFISLCARQVWPLFSTSGRQHNANKQSTKTSALDCTLSGFEPTFSYSKLSEVDVQNMPMLTPNLWKYS
jgi:hypothetical protein